MTIWSSQITGSCRGNPVRCVKLLRAPSMQFTIPVLFPQYNMLHCQKWVQKIIEGSFRAGICSNHIGYRFRSLWSCAVRTALSGLCRFQLVDLCFVPSVQLFSRCVILSCIHSVPATLFPNSKGVCMCVSVWMPLHAPIWLTSQAELSVFWSSHHACGTHYSALRL